LRILHIYKDYYPVVGGIENHVRVVARAQALLGHRVTVVVCNPGGVACAEEIEGVQVVRARRLFTALSMPVSLSKPLIVARQRPDIVHLHSPYPQGELSAWLFQREVPLVITWHSDVRRQKIALWIYAPLLRRVLGAAKRIVATSPAYLNSSPWLRNVRHKCAVIPLGVDTRLFQPAAIPFVGPPTLLFVGKLRRYKGLGTLLRAMPDLPSAQLVIVGDGPMRTGWGALVRQLGLTARVRFLGEVDDAQLPVLYRQAHVFVLPSINRAEAFGTVLLEAMASGLPCVTSELRTGTSWIVQHGRTGLVVAPHDVEALVAAIRKLLQDPAGTAAMGRAARRRVETRFTETTMIDQIMALYATLRNVHDTRTKAAETRA